MHRSTLSYRLRRMSELFGVDVEDPQTFFELQLSLRLEEGM